MGKIIQLGDSIADKIAAGEVVERPASVVKELVENAIDANSTVIEVEVEEAGLAKIRVIDNGEGMDEEDVVMAFERHATSKIKDEADLFRIRTLGFRGEALPSIASVSRMEVVTGTGEGPGSRLVLEGGKKVLLERASSRKGTDITVSDLFFNTPARLKYVKTIHTELAHITDLMNRLALSRPHIAMKLSHNGKVLLQTNGNGDPRQVLAAIYGVANARKMIPVRGEHLDFRLEGYLSLPELTRSSRNSISVFVNGRYVKNYGISNAVIQGYHTLLPVGRFPVAYLHLRMDPELLDVNVHPAKLEIRVSKERELYEFIERSIRSAFQDKNLIPRPAEQVKSKPRPSRQLQFQLNHAGKGSGERPGPLTKEERETVKRWMEDLKKDMEREDPLIREEYPEKGGEVPRFSGEEAGAVPPEGGLFPETGFHPPETDGHPPEISRGPADVDEAVKKETGLSFLREEEAAGSPAKEPDGADGGEEPAEGRFPPLYPIGQMHGTYLLAENENGLYIIDQHAAQERIKYEYYYEKLGHPPDEWQELLIPITLEFSNQEAVKIEENLPELKKIGLNLEPFGTNTYIIRSHPAWFPKGSEKELIEDMIDQVLSMKKIDYRRLREEAAITMSCKRSIKANHRLRKEEIQRLLDDLRQTKNPFTCPHGRPVIVHFSTRELEKMFKRIM